MTIIEITDTLYREANPEGKSDTPSIMYEIIEKKFTEYVSLDSKITDRITFIDYCRLVFKQTDYTKEEMLIMISLGYKMRHSLFTGGEYLIKHPKSDSHFKDESDMILKIDTFWKYRNNPSWNTNWKKYKDGN